MDYQAFLETCTQYCQFQLNYAVLVVIEIALSSLSHMMNLSVITQFRDKEFKDYQRSIHYNVQQNFLKKYKHSCK